MKRSGNNSGSGKRGADSSSSSSSSSEKKVKTPVLISLETLLDIVKIKKTGPLALLRRANVDWGTMGEEAMKAFLSMTPLLEADFPAFKMLLAYCPDEGIVRTVSAREGNVPFLRALLNDPGSNMPLVPAR